MDDEGYDFSALGNRLRWARERKGLTQQGLADAAEVSQATITKIEAGKTERSRFSGPLAQALGVSAHWLSDNIGRPDDAPIIDPERYHSVRLRTARAAAGHGAQNDYDAVVGGLLFLRRSLDKKGLSPSSLEVIFADGDSMAPRISDGDAILVDTSRTEPVHGQVFVVNYDGEELVKRLVRTETGWALVSDNNPGNTNPPIPIRANWDGCKIIGRVVWTAGWM